MQTATETPATATDQVDDRTARVLAKTFYKELRQSGLEERTVLAVATELLGLVAKEIRDS